MKKINTSSDDEMMRIYETVKEVFLLDYLPERDGLDPKEAFCCKCRSDENIRKRYKWLYHCANGGDGRGD